MERVDIGLGIGLQHDLANAEHARFIAIAGDADRELAAGKVLLDQRRLAIARDDARNRRLKFSLRLDERACLAAFAGAFGERLHEGGEIAPTGDLVGASLGDGEGRRPAPASRTRRFATALSCAARPSAGRRRGKADRTARRARALRFAGAAPHALGDGEDDIVALARGEARGEHLPAPHPTGSTPSAASAPASASIVSTESNSATSSSEKPSAR